MDFNQFCDILFPLINKQLQQMYESVKDQSRDEVTSLIQNQLDFKRALRSVKSSSAEFRSKLNPKGVNLYNELSTLRLEIAHRKACPPYIIFSNRTLYEMVLRQPYTMEELKEIYGVGPKNSSEYGMAFLAVIMGITEGTRFNAQADMPDTLGTVPTDDFVADSSGGQTPGTSDICATLIQ